VGRTTNPSRGIRERRPRGDGTRTRSLVSQAAVGGTRRMAGFPRTRRLRLRCGGRSSRGRFGAPESKERPGAAFRGVSSCGAHVLVAGGLKRGDDDHQRQTNRREAQLPLQTVDPASQEHVGDQAGEDGQQQGVDEAVAEAAPEQFKGEVETVRNRYMACFCALQSLPLTCLVGDQREKPPHAGVFRERGERSG